MDNKKIMEFGYEDTDIKLEVSIYGLIFEIDKSRIVEKNTEVLDSDDETLIERTIEELIGEGSIDKINKKRNEDGYSNMTLDVEVAVLTCIYKAYIESTTGNLLDGIENSSNNMVKRAENFGNEYNKRRNNFNKYSRKNYRRY